MESEIRLAKYREATLLAAMSRDLIEEGLGWSWTPPRVMRSLSDPETNAIVAVVDNKIAGFALMKYFTEHAHLTLFAVNPAYRRRGIGKALFNWLAETASVAGILRINLEVRAANPAAREFYRQVGFVEGETVRGYYRGIEAAIRMECRLGADRDIPLS